MRTKHFISNIIMFVCLVVYRLLIDYSYFNEITHTYNYYGFKDYRSFSNGIISWLVFFLFSLFLISIINNKKKSFSDVMVFILSLISIVPFTTLIYSGIFSKSFIIKNIIYWLILLVCYNIFSKHKVKPFKIKIGANINVNNKVALLFGIVSICFILFLSYKYTSFRFNFNLFRVYELRSEVISYNWPTIIQYLFAWTRSINIILLAYCMTKKKYALAFLFFLSQMLSFGIDGLKSTFFLSILVIVYCLSYRIIKKIDFKKLCLYGITGLSFLGVVEKTLLKSSNIITLLIRRVLIFPVFLNSCYVKFFESNPPDYFKASFLRFFGFQTEYLRLDHIIGKMFFHNPDMGCNNGLISEAVTNFGDIGIIIIPIALVLVLRLMDKCSSGVSQEVYFVIAFYFAITISNTFLTTALLTHGLFVSNILFLFLRDNDKIIDGS